MSMELLTSDGGCEVLEMHAANAFRASQDRRSWDASC